MNITLEAIISKSAKNILLLLCLGIVGALVDLIRIPFFYGSELILGPCIALMVASFQGVRAALLVSLISTIPIAIAWGSPWASLIFGLEAVFVAWFYNRIWKNLIISVFVFWVFIGIPLKIFYIKQYDIVLDSHLLTFALKHLLNAVIYSHLAVLITTNEPMARMLHSNKYYKPQSLRKQFTHQLSIIFVTAGLILSLINLSNQTKNIFLKQEAQKEILHSKIEGQLNSIINTRVSAMRELSLLFSYLWNDDIQRAKEFSRSYHRLPRFSTMVLVNELGIVTDFLPRSEDHKIDPNKPLSITDREYFTKAMESKTPYVSFGFQGRGLGKDLIAVISSGIPNSVDQQNIGIVQGSMILGEFEELKKLFDYSSTFTGILLDQNNKTLFSSQSLKINELDEIELTQKKELNQQKVVQLVINSNLRKESIYFYKESYFNWGWKLVTLQDDTSLTKNIEWLLIIYSIALLILALLSEVAAAIISKYWTRELTLLTNEIKDFDIEKNTVSNSTNHRNLPQELNVLYKAIERSKKHVNLVNKNLKQIVNSKTKELQQANSNLKTLANQDYLTQLYNRRYFNNNLEEIWQVRKRNQQILSILIIDIDFFKNVNDNWGHPAGDEVLKKVAKYLKNLNNDKLYCTSRIGGEEFGIICLAYSHSESEQIAQSIQATISHNKIKINDKNISTYIEVTVSIGLASIDASKDSYEYLYKLADKALYLAKQAGRNCTKSINQFN